jgi:hypothetical protein
MNGPGRRCGARARHGGRCKLPAGHGTDHVGFGSCKLHGGATPAGRESAKRARARTEVAVFGLPVDIDPRDALLQEVCRTAGHVAWLRDRIASLPEAELPSSAWVPLYQEEREHLVRVSKSAADAGVQERSVRVAEEQGRLLAGVIRAILGELDLSEFQRAVAPMIVRRHLMALAAPDQPDETEP